MVVLGMSIMDQVSGTGKIAMCIANDTEVEP